MQQGLLLLVQLDLFKPLIDTGLVFAVKRHGLFSGTALIIQIGYRKFPSVLVFGDADQIADFHFLARLAALAIDVHFAAANRIAGQTARLKKTRGPQPLIDADVI